MRREVRCSETLLEHARERFPPGGSVDGQPSFELFVEMPLAAAGKLFELAFDDQPLADPDMDVDLRLAWTLELPFFPPMIFAGILLADGTVEILDFTIDEEYWELVNDDPDD